jgi:hypothetical protein
MFNWCVNNLTGPNAGVFDPTGGTTGFGIGGYNDWYIPALRELQLIYTTFKPTTANNTTGWGQNFDSSPPQLTNYTSSNPAQTTNVLFQEGGTEAFDTSLRYWSSTQDAGVPDRARILTLANGEVANSFKAANPRPARAVRRVRV